MNVEGNIELEIKSPSTINSQCHSGSLLVRLKYALSLTCMHLSQESPKSFYKESQNSNTFQPSKVGHMCLVHTEIIKTEIIKFESGNQQAKFYMLVSVTYGYSLRLNLHVSANLNRTNNMVWIT